MPRLLANGWPGACDSRLRGLPNHQLPVISASPSTASASKRLPWDGVGQASFYGRAPEHVVVVDYL